MTNVINLRQKRKAKARTEKDKVADQNRRIHGRTKGEKKKESMDADRARKHLEGHKREKSDEEE